MIKYSFGHIKQKKINAPKEVCGLSGKECWIIMNENQDSTPVAENKMGTMPIGKLVFNMSLPMMVSMLVQALYNIVDSIFVAKLSENALTAVSLAFPLQTLLIAVGAGTGVGMNALVSRSLGEKNQKRANRIATNGAFIYILSYFLFLIVDGSGDQYYSGSHSDLWFMRCT